MVEAAVEVLVVDLLVDLEENVCVQIVGIANPISWAFHAIQKNAQSVVHH